MRVTERQTRENEPSVDEMRYDLAEQEAMNMGVSGIIDMLLYGNNPLDEVPDIEIRDEWNNMFGENLKKDLTD
jgi:hypothetical protein